MPTLEARFGPPPTPVPVPAILLGQVCVCFLVLVGVRPPFCNSAGQFNTGLAFLIAGVVTAASAAAAARHLNHKDLCKGTWAAVRHLHKRTA